MSAKEGVHGPLEIGSVQTVMVLSSQTHRFPGFREGNVETPNHGILKGITDLALAKRVSVPVQFLTREQAEGLADPARQPEAMRQGLIQGVIVVSAYAETILNAVGPRLAFVVVPSPERPLPADSVGPEHIHGVERLVRYLFQLGHQRIGFVSIHEKAPWTHGRYAGYLYGMNRLGLTVCPGDVFNIMGDHLSDQKLYDSLVERTRDGVTAWVCVSDGLAAQVCRALGKQGFLVPEDVSVTGFDGVGDYRGVSRITTMRVPWESLGQGALNMVLERILHPLRDFSNLEFHGTFLEGKTTAPPPTRKPRREQKA